MAVEPEEFGIVTSDTLLFVEGNPIVREEEDNKNDVGYEDIGGCRRQMALIREMIELPL